MIIVNRVSTKTHQVDATSGTVTAQKSTSGAAHVTPATALAGERNVGTVNQYFASVPECNGSVVNVATTSNSVSSGAPALLFGVYINTTIAVEAVGLHDGTGGTELVTLPIGLAAGTKLQFNGIKFNTSLFVEAVSATGSITVEWRAQ